jgi:glycyl-tRNA synthetase beta chain
MVREFTSLQGVMGGIYAREEGQPDEVWQAIFDQYLPASTDDGLPRTTSGRMLSLIDRLDTLVGFFGMGITPTGSRDPFGLRRAAQGSLRLLLEGSLDPELDLMALCSFCHSAYSAEGIALGNDDDRTVQLLRPFFEDRLRYLFELEGFAHDEIEASLRRRGEELRHVVPLRARVAALHGIREDRDFLSVVLAAKRIANIVKDQPESELDREALELAAERNLAGVAELLDREIAAAVAADDYAAGLRAVARLAPSLEAFFNEVLVLDPDEAKRASRVALLRAIGASIDRLADLSQLVVDKAEYR